MKTTIEVKVAGQTVQTFGGEWVAIDLPLGFGVRYYKSLQGLTDVNEFELDTAVSFSLEMTPKNQIVFAKFIAMSTIDRGNDWMECRVFEGAHQQVFDRIYFRGRSGNTLDFEFRRAGKHWAVLASELKLSDIVLPEKTLDAANILADAENPIWTNPLDPVRWITADYGGWVDLAEPPQFTDPPVKYIWVEDYRPFVSVVHLLQQGFCQIGRTLKGLLFEQPEIRSWYAYLLADNYYVHSKGLEYYLQLEQVGTSTYTGGVLSLDTANDPNGFALPYISGYWMGYTNPLQYKSRHKWTFSGTIESGSGANKEIWASVILFDPSTNLQIGTNGDAEFLGILNAGQSKFITVELERNLDLGESGAILITCENAVVKKGAKFTVKPSQQSLIRGDVIRANELFNTDYTLLDLFKGFLHLTNGLVIDNDLTREVEVRPESTTTINGVTIPGYYSDQNEPEDITLEVVPGSVRFEPLRRRQRQYKRYAFADSTDAEIKAVASDFRPHSREVLNGIDLPLGTDEIKNPFFEPTIDRQSKVLYRNAGAVSPLYPVLSDNTDGNRSFSIGPRIVVFHGESKQFIQSGGAWWAAWNKFEGTATDVLSTASQCAEWIFGITPAPPLPKASIVYGTKPDDLFTRFRLSSVARAKSGYDVELLQRLSAENFTNYDFSKPRKLLHDGFPVTLYPVGIDDFTPASGKSTPMRFLAENQISGCCDLPCNCVFVTCDYFQDLGTYITQAQLSLLRVSSFKVDGIEYVTAPVFLGIYRAIEVDGRPFVTNLVDALRKIAVPYFTYNYSRQVYAGKNDLRFFKIKHPACQSFTIEVSNASEVIYRYTESTMEQKVFGGTFGPFGYGANPVSEPSECETTTEY